MASARGVSAAGCSEVAGVRTPGWGDPLHPATPAVSSNKLNAAGQLASCLKEMRSFTFVQDQSTHLAGCWNGSGLQALPRLGECLDWLLLGRETGPLLVAWILGLEFPE